MSVDRPDEAAGRTPVISVIIPVLNERQQIADVIARTRAAGDCEIVVVDGGSTDGTLERAAAADVLLTAPPGRARQQNAGAHAASGEILLFLHADCRLPPGFDRAVIRVLDDDRIAAGCFRQRIDHQDWRYRWIERGNACRVACPGWIYGDQGLFVRRRLFESLAGFPELPLMEDLYFSKQLRRSGRLVLLEEPLLVSPRRWERRGILRQTFRNWAFVALAHAGVSTTTLARWYGHVREVPP